MSDAFTILNPGQDGDAMDETGIVYGTAPTLRKRPRVVITGENAGEIVRAVATEPNGDEFGLITRPIVGGYPGTSVTVFNVATLVPTGSETTIVTYTVPAGKEFYFIGLMASGNTNALYKLYVANTPVLAGRSSVANLTLPISYAHSPFQVAEGVTIVLKVTHQTNVGCDFEGTILGYIL